MIVFKLCKVFKLYNIQLRLIQLDIKNEIKNFKNKLARYGAIIAFNLIKRTTKNNLTKIYSLFTRKG